MARTSSSRIVAQLARTIPGVLMLLRPLRALSAGNSLRAMCAVAAVVGCHRPSNSDHAANADVGDSEPSDVTPLGETSADSDQDVASAMVDVDGGTQAETDPNADSFEASDAEEDSLIWQTCEGGDASSTPYAGPCPSDGTSPPFEIKYLGTGDPSQVCYRPISETPCAPLVKIAGEWNIYARPFVVGLGCDGQPYTQLIATLKFANLPCDATRLQVDQIWFNGVEQDDFTHKSGAVCDRASFHVQYGGVPNDPTAHLCGITIESEAQSGGCTASYLLFKNNSPDEFWFWSNGPCGGARAVRVGKGK
jgi:hypothetical protein